MSTIIFDIDGTLVESTDFDTRLYIQAVYEMLGDVHIHDDWDRYRHVTDAGILDQIIEENDINGGEGLHHLVQERFLDLVTCYLEASPCSPIGGAVEMMDDLRSSGN